MNPFDLKSVLFAKHAQHVALVHFPIALIVAGAGFDLPSQRKQDLVMLRAAYFTVIAVAIAAVPAVVTGILAWQLQFEGKVLRGNLKLHLLLALVSPARSFGSCAVCTLCNNANRAQSLWGSVWPWKPLLLLSPW